MGNKRAAFAVPYVGWLALFVLAPIVMVVIYAFSSAGGGFTLENFSRMGSYAVVFTRSFKLAVIATVICLLIGYPWMNFLLRTYAWMSILENTGLLNRFFAAIGLFRLINGVFGTDIEYFRMINTQGAVVLGMVYNYLPFMILPIYSVIEKLDVSLVEAARDLGCCPG